MGKKKIEVKKYAKRSEKKKMFGYKKETNSSKKV